MAKNSKIQKTRRSIIFFSLLSFLLLSSIVLMAQNQTVNDDQILADDTLNATQNSSDLVKVKNQLQDEIGDQSSMKKFLHNFDEKKNFRFLLVIVLIAFAVMLFLPFTPALRELVQKKDDQPLFVSMEYTKDPRFFDHSFRSKLLANVDKIGIDRCFRVKLSGHEEMIEVIDSLNVDKFKFGNHVLYLDGDAVIKRNMKFSKEVYVKGKTELQNGTKVRAILSEDDIILGENCKVMRWIGSENNVLVNSNCDLGVRCTCEKTLQLAGNCSFKSLYGHPVITDFQQEDSLPTIEEEDVNIVLSEEEDDEKLTSTEEDAQNIDSENDEDDIVKIENEEFDEDEYNRLEEKPLFETIKFRQLKDDKSTITKNSLVMSRNELALPQNTLISKDLIVKSVLKIGSGSEIGGTIKCYSNIYLDDNVEVDGNIFCDGDIKLSRNCRVWGNLFSQGTIYLANGCEIGTEGIVKSVIGKKGIKLEDGVKIHGYVLTEGAGKTV